MVFQEVPHWSGLFSCSVLFPLRQAVAKERPKEVWVGVLGKLDQVAQVELKAAGELKEELMDAVKPLKRDRKGF